MEHQKHFFRAIFLLIVIIIVYIFARSLIFHPETWIPEAKEMIRSHTPVFGNLHGCNDCHSEVARTRAEGEHKGVSCEEAAASGLGFFAGVPYLAWFNRKSRALK